MNSFIPLSTALAASIPLAFSQSVCGGYYYECGQPSDSSETTWTCSDFNITGSSVDVSYSGESLTHYDEFNTVIYKCPDGYDVTDIVWSETWGWDVFFRLDSTTDSEGFTAETLHTTVCLFDATYTLEQFGCTPTSDASASHEFSCPQPTDASTEWTCYYSGYADEAVFPSDVMYFDISDPTETNEITVDAIGTATVGYLCPDGYTAGATTFADGDTHSSSDEDFLISNDMYTLDNFAGQTWFNEDDSYTRSAYLFSFACKEDRRLDVLRPTKRRLAACAVVKHCSSRKASKTTALIKAPRTTRFRQDVS